MSRQFGVTSYKDFWKEASTGGSKGEKKPDANCLQCTVHNKQTRIWQSWLMDTHGIFMRNCPQTATKIHQGDFNAKMIPCWEAYVCTLIPSISYKHVLNMCTGALAFLKCSFQKSGSKRMITLIKIADLGSAVVASLMLVVRPTEHTDELRSRL